MDLGYLGATESAKEILAGTYEIPEGIDIYTQDFIECLQARHKLMADEWILAEVSIKDHQSYWNKSK
jgi:hypothetical protein